MGLGFRQFSQSYMPSSPSPSLSPSSFSFSRNLFTPFPLPSINKSPSKYLHVITAQSLRDDEGNYYSAKKKKKKNMVDENMSILSQRIKEMKNKERLLIKEEVEIMSMKKKKNDYNNYYYNRAVELKGWNYDKAGGGYDEWTSSQSQRRRVLSLLAETIEIAGFVGTTLGLVFLTGSVFVFLLSLLLLRFQT